MKQYCNILNGNNYYLKKDYKVVYLEKNDYSVLNTYQLVKKGG